MTDDGNRTEKGIAPAPFGTADTLDAPVEKPLATADTLAPDDSAPSASRTLPALDRQRYKDFAEVGRGGLGRILRARDQYLDRPVAVKELLDPDDGAKARFVREALITARLQHPAIVPIYDAGQSEDKGPFYAMKLVAGRSLAEELHDKRTFEKRIAYLSSVIAVVDAMAYAHSEKIIHRDLKPQNVLVGDYGETVLIDWGLAKDLSVAEAPQRGPFRSTSSSSMETVDGAVMGTPAFMPPEQAAGEDVDERADVYALGAMLYFVICGVAPHGGKSMDEMLLKIVSGDVIPVQEREPRCPADLAAIVAKAMAKDPAQRYPTAGELAIDLKKFQTGQLVGAHQYTLGERFRRWLRRNRGIVAVASAAAAILIGYGIWSIRQMQERKEEALAAAALADKNAAEANRQRDIVITQSMLVRARQYAATGHTAEEIAVLRALARPEAGAEARRLAVEDGGLIWKAHQRLAMGLGHAVGISYRTSDGARFLATEPGALVTWDAASGKELARLPIAGDTAARFGKIFAISPAGRFVLTRECAGEPCGVDVIEDGNVFVMRPGTELQLRDVANGAAIRTWNGFLDRRQLAFASDDSVIGVSDHGHVTLLDPHGGVKSESTAAGCTGPLAVASPARFAIACKDHVVLHTEHAQVDILRGARPNQLVFVTPDRLLAIGDTVQLWDVARNELRGDGKLPQDVAPRDDEDESEELPWAYYPPGVPKGTGGGTAVPQIRVGHTTSIVPRTSVLSPPPRVGTTGALLSLEGHDWQALAVQDDLVRYALVEALVPAEPPERCLSRVGGERHAMTALDNGERMLVDQQEIALGLDVAPPEGYRHTTTSEVPVRELRPLLAAETDACLIWGTAVGAHAIDGGAIAPLSGAAVDGHGGIVIVGTRDAYRIDAAGARSTIATAAGAPVISPSGEYVASIDVTTRTLVIGQSATGAAVRTWTAPAGAVPQIEWIAKDVALAFGFAVSVDPAVPPRAFGGGLVTDPRSPFGAMIASGDVIVQTVADGKEVARFPGPAERVSVVPDDSGRVVIEAGGRRELVDRAGKRVALAASASELGTLDLIGGLLVAHGKTHSDAWDVATGALVPIPATAKLIGALGDELVLLDGARRTTLVRMRRDGSGRSERELSTTGIPFLHVTDEIELSPDRTRLAARYAVTDELAAYAVWDLATGALLWIGPPSASVIGDWLVAGGRAYVPRFDVDAVLADTGARTNLRVCQGDLRVVPVVPPPPPDTYWAPASACAPARR